MKVYLIRHGESESNALRIHQDHTSMLTERGIEQAHFVARRLTNVPLAKVMTSPYPRAKHTAEIIAEHLSLPLEFFDLLVETRRPTEVVGQGHESEISLEIDRLRSLHLDDPDWHYSDEESFSSVKQRVIKTLRWIETFTDGDILIVSHKDFIRVFVAIALFGESLTLGEFQNFHSMDPVKNCALTIIESGARGAGHHWQMVSWNDHAHLA